MVSRFGSDFSKVRVHTGTNSRMMNGYINAQAITFWGDVYFCAGQYLPDCCSRIQLLARELAHVVQQECYQQLR